MNWSVWHIAFWSLAISSTLIALRSLVVWFRKPKPALEVDTGAIRAHETRTAAHMLKEQRRRAIERDLGAALKEDPSDEDAERLLREAEARSRR